MEILVCVKQVPGTTQVEVDPVTGTLKRDGVPSKLNPCDLYALETAFRLREAVGGRVRALTMGPPQAKDALKEALAMGADEAVLLSGRAFAGSDVLATAYALSQAVRALGAFDLILCGKQTTDGDTAQVGAELAEMLDLPQLSGVWSLEAKAGRALAECRTEKRVTRCEAPLPCLICMDAEVNTPRLPSFRRMSAYDDSLVRTLALSDLPDADATHYGASGSATQVERVFPPEKRAEKLVKAGSADELADALFGLLRARKFV